MAGKPTTGPNIAACFGHYRQQSVRYALTHCLDCPKMKACVRLTWGMDKPRRLRRGAWDGGEEQPRDARPTRPARPELLAT
ncbi:MAG: hypothetical protein ACRDJE_06660 [Dehalococcoidia bacterium]